MVGTLAAKQKMATVVCAISVCENKGCFSKRSFCSIKPNETIADIIANVHKNEVDICVECASTEAGQWTEIDSSVLFTDVQQFGIKYVRVKCKSVTTAVVESSQQRSTENAFRILMSVQRDRTIPKKTSRYVG